MSLQNKCLDHKHLDKNVLNYQDSNVTVRVYQVQKCALLKAQMMECEERTRWMNTNAEEIKLQLKHTQQGSSHTFSSFTLIPLSLIYIALFTTHTLLL